VQAPGSDVARQPRNLDPALHPFERARNYTQALNATKLERMFAAPFIAQLGKGHVGWLPWNECVCICTDFYSQMVYIQWQKTPKTSRDSPVEVVME
jgi:hypothetical protein